MISREGNGSKVDAPMNVGVKGRQLIAVKMPAVTGQDTIVVM